MNKWLVHRLVFHFASAFRHIALALHVATVLAVAVVGGPISGAWGGHSAVRRSHGTVGVRHGAVGGSWGTAGGSWGTTGHSRGTARRSLGKSGAAETKGEKGGEKDFAGFHS